MLTKRSISAYWLAFVLAMPSCFAGDFDWTGWLGPNRDGQVSNFVVPEEFPQELSAQWSVKVGTGYGTPVVVDDRVFQHGRLGEEEVVTCLNIDSGDVIWQKRTEVPFKMGGGGERHGKGPKSCPVYASQRLFTFSITGNLTAWNAETGEMLWQRNFDDEFGRSCPYWGASSSPIVDGERVIVHFGTDDKGALVALDVATGEVSWRQGSDGASYSSPLVTTLSGVRQVVQWNHRALAGVDIATGKLLWEYPFPHVGTNQNMPTPTIADGCIYVGGENRGLRCVKPEMNESVWRVDELWHQEDVALDMSTAVASGVFLFGMSHYDSGRFFCVDRKSGDVQWKGPPRLGQNVTFLTIPDHVVALVNDGTVTVFDATSGGYVEVGKINVAQTPTWAPPVLLKDALLIKDHDTLRRLAF